MGMTKPETLPKKQSGFKFFAATLFLVGIVSAGAQFVAASTNGIAEYVALGSPTGPGLIAIISGVVMGATCRSWDSWRKWIWLPLVAAVALVFVVMGFTAQSIAREEAAAEAARQAEVAQACQNLLQQIEDSAAEIEDLRALYAADTGIPLPSWSDLKPPAWGGGPLEDQYDQQRAEYIASC